MSDEAAELPKDTIVLTIRREPWTVDVVANVESLDLMISALDHARRYVETEWRIQQALAQQERAKKQMAENERVRSIMGGARRHS